MYSDLYLSHHGVKGQKWGVRRYQNEDGSLTSAGKKRYGEMSGFTKVKYNRMNRIADKGDKLRKTGRDFKKEKDQKFNTAIKLDVVGIGSLLAMHYMGISGVTVKLGNLPTATIPREAVFSGASIAGHIIDIVDQTNYRAVQLSEKRENAQKENPDNPYWNGEKPKAGDWL